MLMWGERAQQSLWVTVHRPMVENTYSIIFQRTAPIRILIGILYTAMSHIRSFISKFCFKCLHSVAFDISLRDFVTRSTQARLTQYSSMIVDAKLVLSQASQNYSRHLFYSSENSHYISLLIITTIIVIKVGYNSELQSTMALI